MIDRDLDANGNTLAVGDRIAWASRASSSAWLTLGTIDRISADNYGNLIIAKTDKGRLVEHRPNTVVRIVTPTGP